MTYTNIIKGCFYGLFLIFLTQVQAQQKINGLAEAIRIEKGLNTMRSDTSKISRLLELTEFYRTLEPKSSNNSNKALGLANKAIVISQKIKFLKGMGNGYLMYSKIEQDRQDFKKTIYFAKKAATYFKAIKSYNLLGEAQVMQWSGLSLLQGPIDRRIFFLQEAVSSFGKAGNKSRQGDCLKEMGDLYQIDFQYKKALEVLKKALANFNSAGRNDLCAIYDLIGAVYTKSGDYKEGIRFGLMAASEAEKMGVKGSMLCTIYNRIGLTYSYLNDNVNTAKYFKKALAIAMQENDIQAINLIYSETGIMMVYAEQYDEAKRFIDGILKKYPELVEIDPIMPAYLYLKICHNLGQKEQAIHYFKTLEVLLKKNDVDVVRRINSYDIMISYLIEINDIKQATYYLDVYKKEWSANFNKRKNVNLYEYEFKLDSIRGNYLSAIKDLQEMKKINDEISNEETKRQINQLYVSYETEKKDRNILQLTKTTALQQKNLEQQRQNLEQSKKMRKITFIVLVLVLIILLLSVLGYYQKKKTNKLLQKKQQVINNANESLQHLLTEKEWLLREIHHRVKNNLHMVAGLLASQTEFIKGKEALKAISDSQHRVQAMSIIHQKLYQTETLSHINMATYINELTEYLGGSFSGNCPVKFKLDIAQVDFPLSHSIPVGLIINEAITNSIKYAFDVCGNCLISILLKETKGNEYYLQIRDNGKGMPENFNINESNSLGMKLIDGLSSDIHAQLKMYNDNGSVIELLFTISDNNT